MSNTPSTTSCNCQALLGASAKAEQAKIGCPMLILVGDQDLVTPLANAQAIAAAVPSARIRIVPATGASHDGGATRDRERDAARIRQRSDLSPLEKRRGRRPPIAVLVPSWRRKVISRPRRRGCRRRRLRLRRRQPGVNPLAPWPRDLAGCVREYLRRARSWCFLLRRSNGSRRWGLVEPVGRHLDAKPRFADLALGGDEHFHPLHLFGVQRQDGSNSTQNFAFVVHPLLIADRRIRLDRNPSLRHPAP